MNLKKITETHINRMLTIHEKNGGVQISESLSKLFDCLNNEKNEYEVAIKVAALNQIYSTAITYIDPVVKKITFEIRDHDNSYNEDKFVSLVDKIATVKWKSSTTGKNHSRCNLSFASKYVHFLSGRQMPIYDSYNWILMNGYLMENDGIERSFSAPIDYEKFFDLFCAFKRQFKLDGKSNYEIDKFLWQYGKELLTKIMNDEDVNLGKAKTILKNRITEHCRRRKPRG